MKVLAVGDMHRKWQDLAEILNFGMPKYDKIVLVGDYADDFFGDASDTIILWDMLLERAGDERAKIIPLMGNHDFAYAFATDIILLFGRPNIQSGFDPETFSVVNVSPDYEKKLIKEFPLTVTIDGVLYTHAGATDAWLEYTKRTRKRLNWDKNYSLDGVRDLIGKSFSPLWVRPPKEGAAIYPKGKKQVFGHTPVSTCTDLSKGSDIWDIDTFSTTGRGDNIGDRSVLEIIDGKKFRVVPESEWQE